MAIKHDDDFTPDLKLLNKVRILLLIDGFLLFILIRKISILKAYG